MTCMMVQRGEGKKRKKPHTKTRRHKDHKGKMEDNLHSGAKGRLSFGRKEPVRFFV